MKPTDLQIGDWILKRGEGYAKVIGIDYMGTIDTSRGITIDMYLKPIPLTLEILERNGFELRDNFLYHRIDDKPHHYDFKLKNGGVFSSEGYTLECGIYHLTIRYTHELQHALRFCGLFELADTFKLEE